MIQKLRASKKDYSAYVIAFAIAVLVFCFFKEAKAEYVDLSQGGMVVSQPMRCDEDRPLVCLVVEKDKTRYLVVHDTKGEFKIYALDGEELKLIWAREMV